MKPMSKSSVEEILKLAMKKGYALTFIEEDVKENWSYEYRENEFCKGEYDFYNAGEPHCDYLDAGAFYCHSYRVDDIRERLNEKHCYHIAKTQILIL